MEHQAKWLCKFLDWNPAIVKEKQIELNIHLNDSDGSRDYKTHFPLIWSMWAYFLFISLCGLPFWWVLTALQLAHNGNVSSVKALPRADAASHRKCLTTFFRQHLWNDKQIGRTDGMRLILFEIWLHSRRYCLFNKPFMAIYLQFKHLTSIGFVETKKTFSYSVQMTVPSQIHHTLLTAQTCCEFLDLTWWMPHMPYKTACVAPWWARKLVDATNSGSCMRPNFFTHLNKTFLCRMMPSSLSLHMESAIKQNVTVTTELDISA